MARNERTPLLQRWSDEEEEDTRPVIMHFLHIHPVSQLILLDPQTLGPPRGRPSSMATMEETRKRRGDSYHVQYAIPPVHSKHTA